jgi:hypothetical protein
MESRCNWRYGILPDKKITRSTLPALSCAMIQTNTLQRLRPLAYAKAHVILIGYAIDNPDSLENVQNKVHIYILLRLRCNPLIGRPYSGWRKPKNDAPVCL